MTTISAHTYDALREKCDELRAENARLRAAIAARAELARRSELAAKYERLTRALAGLVTPSQDVLLLSDGIQVGSCEDFDYDRDPVAHDGTPDSIADAIIASAEAAEG